MKALMGKYIFLTSTYMKEYRKYPLALFVKLAYLPVQMLMYVFLWVNMNQSHNIDLNYLIPYYLLTNLLLYAYPYTYIANNVESDVMEGEIANYLVRPIQYIMPAIAKYVAWICIYSIIFIPAFVFVFIYRGIGLIHIILFLLSALLGMSIEFLFWYNLGLTSLFLERIRGLLTTALAIRLFASGNLIPLSFFSDTVRKVTYLFPFRFYVYVPVNLLLGENEINHIFTDFAAGIIWLIILILISKLLWKEGTKVMSCNIS